MVGLFEYLFGAHYFVLFSAQIQEARSLNLALDISYLLLHNKLPQNLAA